MDSMRGIYECNKNSIYITSLYSATLTTFSCKLVSLIPSCTAEKVIWNNNFIVALRMPIRARTMLG